MLTFLKAAFAATALALSVACPVSAAKAYDSDRITVDVTGSGPDVILVPGLASSREVFDATVTRLEKTHTLHRVQVRGFAGLPAKADPKAGVFAPTVDAIAAYIADRQLERPAIIGHSLGGAAGLALAARYPDRVGRVLVIDALPFYSLLFGPSVTVDTARPFADQARAQMIAQTPEAFAAAQPAAMARLAKDPTGRKTAADWAIASDRATMAQAVHDLMTTDLRPELATIRAPATVLYAWDPVMNAPPAMADGLFGNAYTALPSANLRRVDNSLHFIMWDQPDAFAAKVDAFLAGK